MFEINLAPRVKQNDSEQFNLFREASLPISTEGIKYSGSKLKLLLYILSVVQSLLVN